MIGIQLGGCMQQRRHPIEEEKAAWSALLGILYSITRVRWPSLAPSGGAAADTWQGKALKTRRLRPYGILTLGRHPGQVALVTGQEK